MNKSVDDGFFVRALRELVERSSVEGLDALVEKVGNQMFVGQRLDDKGCKVIDKVDEIMTIELDGLVTSESGRPLPSESWRRLDLLQDDRIHCKGDDRVLEMRSIDDGQCNHLELDSVTCLGIGFRENLIGEA